MLEEKKEKLRCRKKNGKEGRENCSNCTVYTPVIFSLRKNLHNSFDISGIIIIKNTSLSKSFRVYSLQMLLDCMHSTL